MNWTQEFGVAKQQRFLMHFIDIYRNKMMFMPPMARTTRVCSASIPTLHDAGHGGMQALF
jgi:hypothetical protein